MHQFSAKYWLRLLYTPHSFQRNLPYFFSRVVCPRFHRHSARHRNSHEVKQTKSKDITHTRVDWSVFELKLIGGKSLARQKVLIGGGKAGSTRRQWMERTVDVVSSIFAAFCISQQRSSTSTSSFDRPSALPLPPPSPFTRSQLCKVSLRKTRPHDL